MYIYIHGWSGREGERERLKHLLYCVVLLLGAAAENGQAPEELDPPDAEQQRVEHRNLHLPRKMRIFKTCCFIKSPLSRRFVTTPPNTGGPVA